MTDLSAGECLVRLTGRADTPHSRLLRSLTSSSSSLQGIEQASLPPALASFVSSRSALRFAASSTVHHLRFKAVCRRRVRVRTRLAALVSGSSFRPQPDPDVTQARCSIGDCPATPAFRLALTMTPLILCLYFIPSAPSCFRCAQGYRCCEPWAHTQ